MLDKPPTILKICTMEFNQANELSRMVNSNDKLSGIKITINENRETYSLLVIKPVPEKEVLVIINIAPEDIPMPVFWREFCKVQGERER